MTRWMFNIFWVWDGFGGFNDVLSGGSEEKKFNRLHNLIMPYIAKNLRPYVTQPAIQSCGDWGQS